MLPILLPLSRSMLPELRRAAFWALKHAAHDASPAERAALRAELGWSCLAAAVTSDDDTGVRAQAAGLLQNLCKGGAQVEEVRAVADTDAHACMHACTRTSTAHCGVVGVDGWIVLPGQSDTSAAQDMLVLCTQLRGFGVHQPTHTHMWFAHCCCWRVRKMPHMCAVFDARVCHMCRRSCSGVAVSCCHCLRHSWGMRPLVCRCRWQSRNSKTTCTRAYCRWCTPLPTWQAVMPATRRGYWQVALLPRCATCC